MKCISIDRNKCNQDGLWVRECPARIIVMLSWQESAKPPSGAIVASTLLADGRVLLGTQEGALLQSSDRGASFTAVEVENPQPLSDLIEGRPGELVLSGSFGLRVISLPAAAP